jgi:hypothetical protein
MGRNVISLALIENIRRCGAVHRLGCPGVLPVHIPIRGFGSVRLCSQEVGVPLGSPVISPVAMEQSPLLVTVAER